jgi:L-alanine-DL-glutamate epimerase-like enolase superfamily enzyme
MAQEAGLTFTPHTWTNGIGVVANAHMATGLAGSPFLEFPYDPPEWTPSRRDFPMAPPLEHRNGWIELTDRPGLGFDLDEDRLAATRI